MQTLFYLKKTYDESAKVAEDSSKIASFHDLKANKVKLSEKEEISHHIYLQNETLGWQQVQKIP